MAKLGKIVAIAIIASIAICNASPARLERLTPSKSKFLARQEVAEQIPAQTPYPPAGIKPEIRFNLPTDEKLVAPDNTYLPPVGEPAKTYGPPAKTYGPPEVSVKDEVEEVANEEPVRPQEQPQPEEPKSNEPQPEEPKVEEPQPGELSPQQPEEPEAPQQSEEEQQEDNVIEDDTDTEAEEIEAEIRRVETDEGLIKSYPERIVLVRSNDKSEAKLRSAKLQVATPLRRQSIVAQPIYLVNYNGQLYRLLN